MLTFYVGPTLSVANQKMLEWAKKRRSEGRKLLILTPDRMNFYIQSSIFDVLEEKSLFDVEVNTLTRVVQKYLRNHATDQMILSKPAGIGIMKHILLQHKEDFVSFRKACEYDGFASVVYEMICMFKSCNLKPQDIAESTHHGLLTQKLKELAFIYQEYENFLSNQITDSFNRLDLYCQMIKKDDFVDTDILWLGFEDVTPKMMNIVLKMSQLTQVAFSVSYQKKQETSNWLLYRSAPYLTMVDYAMSKGIATHQVWCQYEDKDKQFLSKHLLGVSSNKYALQNMKYTILKANSRKEEIEYALKVIGLQVVKGQASYDDFSLILSQFDYDEKEMENIAKSCQIPLYIDKSISFIEHGYVRMVFGLLELLSSTMELAKYFAIIKYPMFSVSRENIEKVEQWAAYNGYQYMSSAVEKYIESEGMESSIISYFQTFKNTKEKLDHSSTFQEKTDIIKTLLNTVGYVSFLQQRQQWHQNQKEYELARTTGQLYQKWETLFQELEKVLATTPCTTIEYVRILKSVATDMTISLPPVTHHSVKVYNLDKSEITPTKYIYFIGVNAGCFPTLSQDNGIVTDVEMSQLSYAKHLSPTIAQLNERSKRKLLNTLLASNHVVLSYASSDEQGNELLPATVIDQLHSMCNIAIQPISSKMDIGAIIHLEDKELLAFHSFSHTLARNVLAKLVTSQTGQKSELVCLSVLNQLCHQQQYLQQYYDPYKRQPIHNAFSLFYPNHTSSVSQFEKYFSCPYQHFVQYGLRLQENLDSSITSREFGDILHLFCMKFLLSMQKEKDQNWDISQKAIRILDEILKEEKYQRFLRDEQNFYATNSLYKEVVRIAQYMVQERQHSQFVPVVLEGNFEKDALKIIDQNYEISLKGKIDRVDRKDGVFRIVDYKTGSDTFSYTDVASGKKIQLLIYVLAYQKQSQAMPVSAVYLPIRNTFVKEEQGSYKFDGLIPDTKEMLIDMDNRLSVNNYVSTIVNASTDKNGQLTKIHDFMISGKELEQLCDIAYQKIKQAFHEICQGNITPNPLNTAGKCVCDYCQYLPMCKFSKYKGDQERVVQKQNLQDLLPKEDQDETN